MKKKGHVRIYMNKRDDAYLAEHPYIYDDSGAGWFYGEDNVAIRRGEKAGYYWCKLSPGDVYYGEESIIMDPNFMLVATL